MTNFEEAFELTGHGRFNYIVTLTSGLMMLYVMMETVGIGYVTTLAACELKLTVGQKGLINSAALFGITSTAMFWGYLGDRYGRRKVMLPALFASCAVSVGSALTTGFLPLFLLRFISGCFMSSCSATVFAYMGEMHNNARRATAIMYASTSIALTFVIMPMLAWIILSGTWSFPLFHLETHPWRVFMWTWALTGLASAIILIFLPESPRYLLIEYGPDEAIKVLAKMYAWNTRNKKEDYPVKHVSTSLTAHRHGFKVAFENLAHLGQDPLRRCVIISHISMFLIFMLSSSLFIWLPDIFNELYNNLDESVNLCTVMMDKYNKKIELLHKAIFDTHPEDGLLYTLKHMSVIETKQNTSLDDVQKDDCAVKTLHYMVYPSTMLMGIMCTTSYIVMGIVVAKFSKIKYYCVLLATCCLLLGTAVLVPVPILSVILITVGLCCSTSASLLAAIAVEVFPTSVRALALCTLYMCGRLGAAVGANVVGVAVKKHCEALFLMNTILTAGSVLLMLLWPDPQTVRDKMESMGFIY